MTPAPRAPASVEVEPGVHLAVHRWGPEPVAVVLVHGLASTSQLWAPVAERLAGGGVGVAAVDLRGHGESDCPEHGLDTATAASDLAAVLAPLGAPVVLAGQSWGGNVALRVAARRPDLVRGLALVDGGWIRLSARFPDWESARAALTPPDIDGMAPADLEAMVAASLDGFPPGSVQAALSVVRVVDGTVRRRLPVARHLEILRSLWEDDPRQWYPAVKAPTLLLPAVPAGEEPGPEAREAARAIAYAQVRPYPGAHHDLHLQRPDEVAADLRSLL